MQKEKEPHPVDKHVGAQIRAIRWQRGITQKQLAEKIGLKFQQLQKYETGANRVSASRMWEIAEVLGVDVSAFFAGLKGRQKKSKNGVAMLPVDASLIPFIKDMQKVPKDKLKTVRKVLDIVMEHVP